MIRIRSDYAGGNIAVVSIEPSRVLLEQELRDSVNWWFYWNFCVQCDEPGEFVFDFANGEVLGPWGPAYSYDGISWAWLGERSLRSRESFVYRFTADRPEVYFAFSLPYQLHHLERFYRRYHTHPLVRRDILCRSEGNREVPLFMLGRTDAPRSILLSGRHHACESTANYLAEGLLNRMIERHVATGVLDRVCLHYIPFVDIDGVENGDQGKGRAPHDHNRDYTDRPIYETTRAMMRFVSALQPDIGIDLHCPFKWGDRHDHVFFVKTGTAADRRIERFGRTLQRLTQMYDPVHDIEKGEDWNQPSPTCAAFMLSRNVPMAFSMEIPYFGLADRRVTTDSLRELGGCVAEALELHIEEMSE
ncbi:hypothetical protein [Paenibacillus sp. HJGM_3]|uniref:hypothetical protein n=1 Tax=Paenibacillus sp. HJGM_3 TaxID=3379816 RepID=UPI00385A3879